MVYMQSEIDELYTQLYSDNCMEHPCCMFSTCTLLYLQHIYMAWFLESRQLGCTWTVCQTADGVWASMLHYILQIMAGTSIFLAHEVCMHGLLFRVLYIVQD